MDALISAAARALAAGDPLGALKRVALREDPAALALRGIAMAQLGDYLRAKALLRRAGRAFGARESLARARCVVAEAEVALASRELGWPKKALDAARAELEARGDRVNAAHARYLEMRWLLLTGKLEETKRLVGELDPAELPAAHRTVHELLVAGIAMRRLEARTARAALERAGRAARESGIPALRNEVESALQMLDAPAARLIRRGGQRTIVLAEVEKLLESASLVVDACRYVVRDGNSILPLASRPVLFALARELAEAWPGDVPRETLIERVFRIRHADETHRARLRVEIGRLRKLLRDVATVRATRKGFELVPKRGHDVVVLARPVDETYAAVLALLADGEAWSTSSLALALGTSQRSVQRALQSLADVEKVEALGRGRARRWITPPMPGITTTLLLPGPLPGD